MERLVLPHLLIRKFRTERASLPYNPILIDVHEFLQILAWVGFPDMCREGAAGLVVLVIRVLEVEFEVVVPLGIGAQGRVIFEGRDVDGCTYDDERGI